MVIALNNSMKLDESVSFQVNNAVRTDRLQNQWMDLGIHTEACMTRPETCGPAGVVIIQVVIITTLLIHLAAFVKLKFT